VTGITAPNEDFVDVLAFFSGGFDGDVRIAFVIDPFSVAIVAVCINKDTAAGVGGAETAGFAAESAEDDGVNDAESRAGKHGDGKLGDHGHVNSDAVAGLEAAEVAEHCGGFVHTDVEFAIGEDLWGFMLGFRDENEGCFVFVLGQMAINAVVGSIELAADEPFPEGRFRSVESFVPLFVPVEEIGVGVKTFWKIFLGEFLDVGRISEISLRFEFLRWIKIFFFFPVDRNLGFGELFGFCRA